MVLATFTLRTLCLQPLHCVHCAWNPYIAYLVPSTWNSYTVYMVSEIVTLPTRGLEFLHCIHGARNPYTAYLVLGILILSACCVEPLHGTHSKKRAGFKVPLLAFQCLLASVPKNFPLC